MLRGLKVNKDPSAVILAPQRWCELSLWPKGVKPTSFVCLASLLRFYTREKYLRENLECNEVSFSFWHLSPLAKGWKSLLQGLPGTSTHWWLTCSPDGKPEEFRKRHVIVPEKVATSLSHGARVCPAPWTYGFTCGWDNATAGLVSDWSWGGSSPKLLQVLFKVSQ